MMMTDPSGSLVRTATFSDWVEGARLRTLPLAVAPVVLGGGIAAVNDQAALGRILLALVVSLGLQIGVNFANDYSDGIRGTDDDRVGPTRLTAGRLVRPGKVKLAAFACFGVSGAAGLALVVLTGQWWLVLVGVLAIVAAWYYTGGEHPYGYIGLGELMVFVFFGLVATLGTVYVQDAPIDALAWLAAVAMGLFSCAVLMINNIRDIESDAATGKRTLAVRLGMRHALALYLELVPIALLSTFWAVAGFLSLPIALVATRFAVRPREPMERVRALKYTSIAALAYAVAVAAGLALAG